MSDRLTFLWIVGTCNLGHTATGPQEALWNTVKVWPKFGHTINDNKVLFYFFYNLFTKGTDTYSADMRLQERRQEKHWFVWL